MKHREIGPIRMMLTTWSDDLQDRCRLEKVSYRERKRSEAFVAPDFSDG